jgi:hypothetical protein
MEKTPNDKLICEFCKNRYTRAHRSKHRKTKTCQAYQNAMKVFLEVLHNGNDQTRKTFMDFVKEPYTDKKGNTVYLTKKQLYFRSNLG